jgi:hypothetical protein
VNLSLQSDVWFHLAVIAVISTSIFDSPGIPRN